MNNQTQINNPLDDKAMRTLVETLSPAKREEYWKWHENHKEFFAGTALKEAKIKLLKSQEIKKLNNPQLDTEPAPDCEACQ